jgi:hypothetical protein
MARKKAVITHEWDAARKELDEAIAHCDPVSDTSINGVETKHKKWTTLLAEAVAKIEKWEGEQATEREAFKTFVKTQKEKAAPNYVHLIGGLWATEELYQQVGSAVASVERADEKIKAAIKAVREGNAEQAVQNLGIAASSLKKGVNPSATNAALTKQAGVLAAKHHSITSCVRLDNGKLKARFQEVVKGAAEIQKAITAVEGDVDHLFDQMAAKPVETKNSNPAYKRDLDRIQKGYKSVVDETKVRLDRVKAAYADIAKLEKILEQTVASNARALVPGVMKVYTTLNGEFKTMEQNIQDKIRTSSSTYAVAATQAGISDEDRIKTLTPLMNRAFGLNIQGSDLYRTGKEKLADILQALVERFNNAEAKSALGQVK